MNILQDFTTYTNTETAGTLTIAATRITAINENNADVSYVYKDFGASYFDSLSIVFEALIETASSTGVHTGVVLSTNVGEVQDVATNLFVDLNRETGGYRVGLWRGDVAETSYIDYLISPATIYYFLLQRIAGSDTVTLKVYSDVGKTTQVGATLSVSGFGTTKWRYLYGINHWHQTAKLFSGYIQNMSISQFYPRVMITFD
jgi:hypothetical protein